MLLKRLKLHPSPKQRVVRLQTTRKIRKNIRNSASSLHWRCVQDPSRDVFEFGGSTCNKDEVG